MTEGTSQGLFVVVAIVIFGIFVGLSYTLFGSEGLSNDLKGLFENAIEIAKTNQRNVFKASAEDIQKCLDAGYSGKSVEDENYTYTFNVDCNELTISQYKFSFVEQEVVVIPESYMGIPITKTENLISGTYSAEKAFTYVQVKKVVLPETITEIGSHSFNYGVIEDINFPDGLKTIGKQAFDKTNLGDVVLPDSLISIDYMAFRHAQLTAIKFPTSLRIIGTRAFSGNNYIVDYTIPKNVTSVADGAFNSESSREVAVYFNSEFTELSNTNAYGLTSINPKNMVAGQGKVFDTKTGNPIDVTIHENIQ